ncbi:MAG: hypothetical protein IT210_26365 [Armatimonadetes bacterium]|nr:hypothetical protein [Armatimonadota bacterium]
MPVEAAMPKLDHLMEEGAAFRWLKQDGDPIARGDLLLEVERAKVQPGGRSLRFGNPAHHPRSRRRNRPGWNPSGSGRGGMMHRVCLRLPNPSFYDTLIGKAQPNMRFPVCLYGKFLSSGGGFFR